MNRERPLRWANRRRQRAAGVPWARCRLRPVGLGRRDGPAAGLGYSSGEATISSTSGAVNREWPLRWANRRRRWAAAVPWARCRHRGPREGPAWGTHWHSSGETSGSTASGTQLRPQVTAKVSVAVSIWAAVRLLPDLGYPVTPMLAKHHPSHVGVGARHDRFSTIDERGRRCLREPAHGLGEWPRAIARPGRAFTGP